MIPRIFATLLVLAILAAVGLTGYWAGERDLAGSLLALTGQTRPAVAPPSGSVIYYGDPDGKPFYSLEPKRTPDGRSYRAVLASEDVTFDPKPPVQLVAAGAASKRVLYYRNPMGLPDISPTPKKDSMGMDYIPVYEGEEQNDTGGVRISPGRIQRLGVKSEPVQQRPIVQLVRAPGTIQLAENRVSIISLRAEAFIESVENVTTGTQVRKGQPLMRIYSPPVAAAAAEFLTTLATRPDTAGSRASRQKLLNYGVSDELVTEIERTREVPLVFTWIAPRDGVVIERSVVEGMRAMPGDALFRIADHSAVWALVDVAERDLAAIAAGQAVSVKVRSYPDRTFSGRVALVYPHLNAGTRTVRVRIELANPTLLLRPDMFAEAEIMTGTGVAVLSVPDNAVIDSGDRQIVIIDKGDGRFEPRPVLLGRRGSGYVEIRSGVSAGEQVVTAANFLIDAESNLKAALRGLADTRVPQ